MSSHCHKEMTETAWLSWLELTGQVSERLDISPLKLKSQAYPQKSLEFNFSLFKWFKIFQFEVREIERIHDSRLLMLLRHQEEGNTNLFRAICSQCKYLKLTSKCKFFNMDKIQEHNIAWKAEVVGNYRNK